MTKDLQNHGYDTVDANLAIGLPVDRRDYSMAAKILKDFYQPNSIELLTNNPEKLKAISSCFDDVRQVPITSAPNVHNIEYLKTKKVKLGHSIDSILA